MRFGGGMLAGISRRVNGGRLAAWAAAVNFRVKPLPPRYRRIERWHMRGALGVFMLPSLRQAAGCLLTRGGGHIGSGRSGYADSSRACHSSLLTRLAITAQPALIFLRWILGWPGSAFTLPASLGERRRISFASARTPPCRAAWAERQDDIAS